MPALYDDSFYSNRQALALASAREVVPLIISDLHPSSVIDVGCGNGVWLSLFHEHGIDDFIGIDGQWVNHESLLIPSEKFLQYDLSEYLPELGRRFDLALTIEVAEHLNAARADAFVKYLTNLADVVVFSAAIPGQGGTGHVNEQWQSYWTRRFAGHGYIVSDELRPRLWNNPAVDVVHAQNILIYRREDDAELLCLYEKQLRSKLEILDVVHPRLFNICIERARDQSKCFDVRLVEWLSQVPGIKLLIKRWNYFINRYVSWRFR